MVEFYPYTQNFIKSMVSHPCARPWYVWVETFIPAFIKLFLTVTLFDFNDALRMHGKALTYRKGVPSARRGRHAGRVRVPGRVPPQERWMQKGLRTLLVVTQPLERIGFVWLLYSATDQFFADWQSLLELSEFCNSPQNSGPLSLRRGPGLVSFLVGGVPVPMTNVEQDRAGWGASPIGVSLPPGRYSAGFSMSVRGPPFGVSPVWIQIRVESLFAITNYRSEDITLGPSKVGDLAVRAEFSFVAFGGGGITWEIGGSTIPIGIEVIRGFLFVQRNG